MDDDIDYLLELGFELIDEENDIFTWNPICITRKQKVQMWEIHIEETTYRRFAPIGELKSSLNTALHSLCLILTKRLESAIDVLEAIEVINKQDKFFDKIEHDDDYD